MDNVNQQWDLADQELDQWLNGETHKSHIPLSDILKSTFLTFRQKQFERFNQLCTKAFEFYIEQERISAELLQEPIFEDNVIRFQIVQDLSDSEKRDKRLEKNKKVIDGILSGNQKIFNDLYEYEFPKVVNLIKRYSGNIENAKDVFQDAVIILIEKVYSNTLDLTCSIETYLFSICKYLWMNQLRQKERVVQMNKFLDKEHFTNDFSICFYSTPDIYENVNSEINKLGDPCQQLLECYYYKQMSWEEIATKLGYASAASARNQKYKCLERIRSKINMEVE
jgi:RNA polymerase sigma factor (sigma-70 family)